MEDTRTTTVEVARLETHHDAWPAGNLFAFMEQLREIMDSVPPEWRDRVEIDFGASNSRDGFAEPWISVLYERPETPEEAEARRRTERDAFFETAEWIRRRSVQLYDEAREAGMDPAKLGLEIGTERLVLEKRRP